MHVIQSAYKTSQIAHRECWITYKKWQNPCPEYH